MESGWAHVTQLRLECQRERTAHGLSPDQRLVHLIAYVETEVLGVFIECAEQSARLVSKEDGVGEGLETLYSLASRVERGLVLCGLASESAHLPPRLKATLAQVTNALADWPADFCALVTVARQEVHDRPYKPQT
ncbi:MAG TPA: hypothetical protein VNP72_03245 [Longimicrobium sp.]|nr:hypothetical protein [Longimicrobium sp.]